MTKLTWRNALAYLALWALNALVAWVALNIASGAIIGFAPGEPFAAQAQGTATTLTLIASGLSFWLAAHRPRLGREDINNLINEVGTFDALGALRSLRHSYDESIPPLTDEETTHIADKIYERIETRIQTRTP
jgi:hypothetical protein